MKPEQKLMVLTALEKSGRVEVTVGGWSMWPFIHDGDVIEVSRGLDKPYYGKVAVFFIGDQFIAHRIVRTAHKPDGTEYLKVAGDSLSGSASSLAVSEVVGTVTAVKGGSALKKCSFHFPFCFFSPFLAFQLRFLKHSKEKADNWLQLCRKIWDNK